ncbi:MAG: MotA/TolQ/ExbB proton channel family protein [Candidatus Schekmanbacteria bacterium]|nr:MotA/TolQ/ExbB proton channel family protein [Candidatus Schekmanbacteria bacterium]
MDVNSWYETFPLLDYFDKGGPVMWPLLACSIVAVTFIIERFWHYHKASIDAPEFLDRIGKVLQKGKIKEATKMCEAYTGPVASILKAGLLRYDRGKEEIERAIEASGSLEMARLERGLVVLASVANLAPLLGFLGTVTGMINSFEAIAKQGLNNPALVSIGISEALITTAGGLMIAIPVLAFYNYFTSRVSKIVLDMEESSAFLVEYMGDLESASKAAAAQGQSL